MNLVQGDTVYKALFGEQSDLPMAPDPLRSIILLVPFLCLSLGVRAQKEYSFSGQAHTGFMINQTDLSKNDFPTEKPNLFVSGGLSYYIELMDAWVCGDVSFGNMDGNNDTAYFKNIFYSGALTIKFDMIKWFADTRLKLSPKVGIGLMLYTSQLYAIADDRLIQQSPPASGKAFSPNPNFEFGADLSYPITDRVDIEIGYARKTMFGNDYFDAFLYDTPIESVDLVSAGMVFKFGKGKASRHNSKKIRNREDVVEMTTEEYRAFVGRIDSLESKLAKSKLEAEEKLKLKNQSLREQIASLNRI
ncbi:MAG TPA: hypothetical protein DDW81_14860, partial [Cryomorphaceae bacterium]|nr:hypothetical protein [Cryomorphaceae bacterium]